MFNLLSNQSFRRKHVDDLRTVQRQGKGLIAIKAEGKDKGGKGYGKHVFHKVTLSTDVEDFPNRHF